ncbi:putative uncharacterized protein [Burkholderiales bacterium GJ-E10]|nr:putative uncharacterized protein [Burkholderiales bacterium GJ-E10]
MSRSIAQQLEYWAMLGRARESKSVIHDESVAATLHARQELDRKRLELGEIEYRDTLLFGRIDMTKDVRVDYLHGIEPD